MGTVEQPSVSHFSILNFAVLHFAVKKIVVLTGIRIGKQKYFLVSASKRKATKSSPAQANPPFGAVVVVHGPE